MIVEKIGAYLNQHEKTLDEALRYEVEKIAGVSFKRQFMTEETETAKGVLRPSSIGRCVRQVSYAYHGIEKAGKELDSRAKIIFWQGDMVENMIIALAKISGCSIVCTGLNQLRVTYKVGETVINGYPDGVLLADHAYLVEVKSMSSYAFERFENGEIDEGYLAQINTYMDSEELKAMNVQRCVVVALNKDNGILSERILEKNADISTKVVFNICRITQSMPDKLPEPPEELNFNEKRFYPWNCLYCAWWKKCRTNAEQVLVGKSYKLKEKKEVIKDEHSDQTENRVRTSQA